MKQKNNRGIITLFMVFIVILEILYVLSNTGTIILNSDEVNDNVDDNNQTTENNKSNDLSENDESNDLSEDKELNLKDGSYSKEYINEISYEILEDYCMRHGDAFLFEIKDGKLNLTNKRTNETKTLDTITNIKSILHVHLWTSCTSDQIILLTNDGKLYETSTTISEDINDINEIDNMFHFINLSFNVKEIGIIKGVSPAMPETLLIKDENDIEYYRVINEFYKIS